MGEIVNSISADVSATSATAVEVLHVSARESEASEPAAMKKQQE